MNTGAATSFNDDSLTISAGQGIGVTVPNAVPEVEGVRLFIEGNPDRATWPEFKELDGVRPRI